MKLKHILIPYVILIVIIPAIITHLFVPLKINQKVWETGIDIVMAIVSFGGLITVIIRRKRKFRGWILLLLLIVLIIGPQMYLWKTQNRGFTELRIIYRFALLYISLFVIPLEIHFSRKEQLIIIFGFCLFGLFCCSYELIQHPRVWESMEFFSGKTSAVTSFFNHRNRFAAYNALWLILCLFAIQLSGSPLWLIPGSVFGIFVILTESRGAMLLSAIFILMSFISYRHRIGTKNMLIILLDLSIVIIILWLIPPVRRFLTAFIGTDRGVAGRDKLWRTAWKY